ncbi:putative Ig domain-containing protein [Staphylococcus epidermidis]
MILWLIPPSEVGSYDITVTTTDESGNATEITFTINVEDTSYQE